MHVTDPVAVDRAWPQRSIISDDSTVALQTPVAPVRAVHCSACLLRRGSNHAPKIPQCNEHVPGRSATLCCVAQGRAAGRDLVNLGIPGGGGYSASKAAVARLVRALAVQLAPAGITANAILPGFIETECRNVRRKHFGMRRFAAPRQAQLGRWPISYPM